MHRGIEVGRLHAAHELGDQLRRQSVPAFGAIERDPGHATGHLVGHRRQLAGHVASARSTIALDVDAGGQRPVCAAALPAEPGGAERVGDRGWGMADEQAAL